MGLAALSLKAARSSVIIPELPVSDVELFIKSVTRRKTLEKEFRAHPLMLVSLIKPFLCTGSACFKTLYNIL